MSRFAAAASIALLGTLSAVTASQAVEWAVVGARAAGMWGAGVAVTSDALELSAQAVDRMGLKDTIDDIKNFNTSDPSLGNIDKANDIANRINRPGSTLSAIAAGGLYFKGYIGEHAFGFNVSDVATAGMFVSRPVRVTCAGSPACGPGSTSVTLEGQMALNGLEARQAVAS